MTSTDPNENEAALKTYQSVTLKVENANSFVERSGRETFAVVVPVDAVNFGRVG